jgi:hypothetical protein
MKKQFLLIIALLLGMTGTYAQSNSTNGQFTATGAASNVALRTQTTTRLTILRTNGNVGINTTTPTEMLDVNGNIRGTQFNSVNGIYNTIGATNLRFNTNNTTRLTVLNSSGFVGIATATPLDMLHVNGGSVRANQFNAVNGIFNVQSASNFSLNTNNTTRLTVLNSNGFVGIGITAPTQALHISGNILADGMGNNSGIFRAMGASNFTLQTSTNDRLTILNSNGFVGIGKTTPAFMLDVAGPVNASQFLINGVPLSTSGAPSQWTTAGNDISYSVGKVGIGTASPLEQLHVNGTVLSNQSTTLTGVFASANTNNLSLRTNTTDRVTVLNSTGFVGIGTNAPSELLHVSGNVLANQLTASSGAINSSAPSLNLQTSGVNRLSVTGATGNVGIGTATPEDKLQITGGNLVLDNANTPSIFTGTGATEHNRYLQILNSPGQQTASGLKAGGILVADVHSYANPGKNDLIIKGRVGVGTPLTTNPNNYTLAVNGSIGAKDVRVEKTSTTWPDYVFDTKYELPSLTDVAAYINTNKHLPEVPSAEEVEKNGHSLGDMDAILLKKVEELTLYIIKQQQEIDTLKKKLDGK